MVKPSPAQRTQGAFLKQELKLGSWHSNLKRQMGQTPRSAPMWGLPYMDAALIGKLDSRDELRLQPAM
jgi:hypothetical protein